MGDVKPYSLTPWFTQSLAWSVACAAGLDHGSRPRLTAALRGEQPASEHDLHVSSSRSQLARTQLAESRDRRRQNTRSVCSLVYNFESTSVRRPFDCLSKVV